ERVMVRVGGGWADLGEYLKEYAMHHGSQRRVVSQRVEVTDLPARKLHSTTSNASLRTESSNPLRTSASNVSLRKSTPGAGSRPSSRVPSRALSRTTSRPASRARSPDPLPTLEPNSPTSLISNTVANTSSAGYTRS